MAGLLDMIAKRLFGSTGKTAQKTTYSTTSAKPWTQEPVEKLKKPAPLKTESSPEENEPQVTSGITAYDRTFKRERTNREVGREDLLLSQIDEFREKAQQLQNLLLSKESKVAELQNIVDEREGKAKELQNILEERQRKADGITEEMNKQIDNLIEKVTAKMSEIEASMSEDLADGRKISEEQAAQMKESLAALTTQLESLKADLSDKIHSENVKCYRNVADLLKGLEDKMDKVSVVEKKVGAVHKFVIAVIILTAINMVGLTVFALFQLGAFRMFLG